MAQDILQGGHIYRPDRSLKGKLRRRLVRFRHVRPVRSTHGAAGLRPMISFCFDDVTDTSVSIGAALLEARGLRGTFFVCAGLLGETGHMGAYATRDQLVRVAAAGHDIGCHTFSHLDCGQASARDIAQDLERNSLALANLGVARPTTFAFPFGDVSAAAKYAAGSRFRLCRALHHGVIGRDVDLNQAPAVGIEGAKGEAVARRWMRAAARQGGWLILYTHTLGPTASEFGCSVETFTRLVDEAIAGGFDIVTVARGADLLAGAASGTEAGQSPPAPPPVAVVIPTLRRQSSLGRALASLFAQDDATRRIAEIVVVDNAPEGSARQTVEDLRATSPAPLVYVHEPRPGVATARNAGVRAVTRSGYIAFLDDDEEAPPGWLAALTGTHFAFQADVTFGPVRGVADVKASQKAYIERFFSRIGPASSGLLEDTLFGCGNSILTRATALPGPAPFDPAADLTGGEDDRLFNALKAKGARFAWAADAFVYEHAAPHRARLAYTFRRAMGYGQGPSQSCARQGDWIGVVGWMLVGAAQASLYGALAAALWILNHPARFGCADKAVRGLGKLLWPRTLTFYGVKGAERAGAG
jgi:peptidoglycan/xylan/chitin deacetylase (PgdA/CDA1 family)